MLAIRFWRLNDGQRETFAPWLEVQRALADLLVKQNKIKQAEHLVTAVREKCKKDLGEKHPDTLECNHTLANFLSQKGTAAGLDQAETLHRETLQHCKDLLGEKHPRTLRCMKDLANVMQEQKDFEEAEALLKQAVDDFREIVGDTHPETLDAQISLAFCLSSTLGCFNNLNGCKKAEPLFRGALEKLMETQDDDDPVPWRFKTTFAGPVLK